MVFGEKIRRKKSFLLHSSNLSPSPMSHHPKVTTFKKVSNSLMVSTIIIYMSMLCQSFLFCTFYPRSVNPKLWMTINLVHWMYLSIKESFSFSFCLFSLSALTAASFWKTCFWTWDAISFCFFPTSMADLPLLLSFLLQGLILILLWVHFPPKWSHQCSSFKYCIYYDDFQILI